jgi:DNA-binding XRE family transcriptional regulator
MNVEPIRKIKSRELRLFRIECRVTQVQLSKLSGLMQSTISRIERGKVSWSIDNEIIYMETLRRYVTERNTNNGK